MSKYAPLGAFLATQRASEVPMAFSEIERIIQAPLPPKAKDSRAWWSNNPSNNVMTKVWLDAGFQTERVDIPAERLIFRRKPVGEKPVGSQNPEFGVMEHSATFTHHHTSTAPGFFAQVRERLGGTVTLLPGVDLTAPLWADEGGEV